MDQPSEMMWCIVKSTCSSSFHPNEGGAQQWSGSEIERTRGFLGGEALRFRVTSIRRVTSRMSSTLT